MRDSAPRAIAVSGISLRRLVHTFVTLWLTRTSQHPPVTIFTHIKSKIRFHQGGVVGRSTAVTMCVTGKMSVKYANLSICLISHLHIKDCIERWGTFVLSREKKMRRNYEVHACLCVISIFFSFANVSIFSPKKKKKPFLIFPKLQREDDIK